MWRWTTILWSIWKRVCTENILLVLVKLIPNEQDRLEYLISFCLKNYYIGYANKLSSGEFIPKWKHEDELQYARELENKVCNPEVKVIVNGHRYNVTWEE